jgi:hypothetical protein
LVEAHLGQLKTDPGADALQFDGARLSVPE